MNDERKAGGTRPDHGEVIRPVQFEPARATARGPVFRISRYKVATGLAILVFVLIVWYLLAARAVFIEAEPAHAETDIESLLQFRIGSRFLLLPGTYRLTLTAEGYHPLKTELAVGPEPDQRFHFELDRLPGHLVVDSGPVRGADVVLDGEPRGRTPVTVRDVPYGEHHLQVTADRYFPWEKTVEVEGLGREQEVEVRLVPAWADVTLASEPAGAEVLVDEEVVGVTPLTTEILEGRHQVRVRHDGYKAWQQELDITAGQPVRIEDIRLEPAEAVLYLESVPSRASVTVDGEYRGLTPLELALKPDRTSTIRLFHEGYQRVAREVRGRSGERDELTVRLPPLLGKVNVKVEPADARVFVDGAARGTGPQTLELPAVEHRIEVRREGYVDQTFTVIPHPDFPQELAVVMKTVQQAKRESVKPVLTTSQGQVLKLFRPDQFTMGASRREPGRRANEVLHTVKLTRPFYLSVKEVTNREFRAFRSGHSSGQAGGHSLDGEEQPVVNVTWDAAALYCNWLSKAEGLRPFYRVEGEKVTGFDPASTGYRLPTEAEWAWAARVAPSGLLKFPWGAEMPPPAKSGNYGDESASGILGKVLFRYDDGFPVTAPVGSFAASANGLYDMGGNASEWVHDFYGIPTVGPDEVVVDPMGPAQGEFRVIRGSSWMHANVSELRLSFRDYDSKARPDVGFRIARFLE
jgi:formylglycine-generating enzyme required for sulfatase activity